jgi:predicted nuclease of predicted toxin-antitoxin system
VKLLFDENLSPKLAGTLAADYPGSTHVRAVGLRGAEDAQIWSYARDHGFTIISKDNDFRQRSFLQGAPPKVIWLEVGNAGTDAIAGLLRAERGRLSAFEAEPESALLVLSLSVRAV